MIEVLCALFRKPMVQRLGLGLGFVLHISCSSGIAIPFFLILGVCNNYECKQQ